MSAVFGMDHISLLVQDADKAATFYQNILGLAILERPDLGFPGVWLDLGEGQSLHLLQVSREHVLNDRLPEHGGRDFHFALRIKDLETFVAKLEQAGVAYTKSRSGRKALFFRDLDGNAIELTEVD
ncbi:VOC family protein [Thiomicrorhabdus xiamenensis]|uniref:VOC family protein n=1 Tax=Thiomicrorhabdus xiamenensis TaxID=2739063 RepID=A0A7D4SSC9_9GAMM|nr:VOC family protein [Thiomicrorhabdus xiamenensis]QKI89243.1 VOC family protein [Thiomicrorhabdus xiamenensis]